MIFNISVVPWKLFRVWNKSLLKTLLTVLGILHHSNGSESEEKQTVRSFAYQFYVFGSGPSKSLKSSKNRVCK